MKQQISKSLNPSRADTELNIPNSVDQIDSCGLNTERKQQYNKRVVSHITCMF